MPIPEPVFIDIDIFTHNAVEFYERAKNGERIIITIDGEKKYEVFTDITQARDNFSELPRPSLTEENYGNLLDLLDPLDDRNF